MEIPGFTRLREQWGDQLLGASTLAALRERMAIDVEPLLAQASASSAVASVTGIGERFADLKPRVEIPGVAEIAGTETWSAELGAPLRESIARWQTETGGPARPARAGHPAGEPPASTAGAGREESASPSPGPVAVSA